MSNKKMFAPIVRLLEAISLYEDIPPTELNELYELTTSLKNMFDALYIQNHPCEACVCVHLFDEIKKIDFVQKEVWIFLEKVKETDDIEKLESCYGIYEAVYEIISAYYPLLMSFDEFCQLIPNIKAKRVETKIKKLTRLVIADAVAEDFQEHIKKCYGEVDPNEAQYNKCLCWLIQFLKDANFESKPIGRIIEKTDRATDKLSSRCGKAMEDFANPFAEELYWQTIGRTDQE